MNKPKLVIELVPIKKKRLRRMRKDAVDILRLIAEGHDKPRQLAQNFFQEWEETNIKVKGMD